MNGLLLGLIFILNIVLGWFYIDVQTVLYAIIIYFLGLVGISLFVKRMRYYNFSIYSVIYGLGSLYIILCYIYMSANSYEYLLAPDISAYFLPKSAEFLNYKSVVEAQFNNWSEFNLFGRNHVGYFSFLIPFAFLSDYLNANYYVSMQFSTLVIASLSGIVIFKLLLLNSFFAYRAYIYTLIIAIFSTIFFYSTQLLRDILVMFFYLIGIYLTFNKDFNLSTFFKIIIIVFISCTLRIETGLFLMVIILVYLLASCRQSGISYKWIFSGLVVFSLCFGFILSYFGSIYEVFNNNSEYYLESDKGDGFIGVLQDIPIIGGVLSIIYNAAQPLPVWYKLDVPLSDNRPEIYNIMTFPLVFSSIFNWLVVSFIICSIFFLFLRSKVYFNLSTPLFYHLIVGFIFLYIQSAVVDQRRILAYYVVFYILFFLILKYSSISDKRLMFAFFIMSYLFLQLISLFKGL